MRALKHLPLDQWPAADHAAFAVAYAPGDLFDDTAGPGAHLAAGTRRKIQTTYRRWLGFLRVHHPVDLQLLPAERITPERVRAFLARLSEEVRPASVAIAADGLYYAARLMARERDWRWLAALKARLHARARPADRFDRLVPPRDVLDYGIELMDTALTPPVMAHKAREAQFRDGLLLVLLSLWPIRRRSLGALTVSRHIVRDADGISILLHAADTKSKRADSFRVPDEIVPYVIRYLDEIRPRLMGPRPHDGFWASRKLRPLSACRLYDIARVRVLKRFGKAPGLHDFRRAAATHLAMDAPEKVGLIPGVLQHTSPEVGDQHYNLARAIQASQRFAAHRAKLKESLRRPSLKAER